MFDSIDFYVTYGKDFDTAFALANENLNEMINAYCNITNVYAWSKCDMFAKAICLSKDFNKQEFIKILQGPKVRTRHLKPLLSAMLLYNSNLAKEIINDKKLLTNILDKFTTKTKIAFAPEYLREPEFLEAAINYFGSKQALAEKYFINGKYDSIAEEMLGVESTKRPDLIDDSHIEKLKTIDKYASLSDFDIILKNLINSEFTLTDFYNTLYIGTDKSDVLKFGKFGSEVQNTKKSSDNFRKLFAEHENWAANVDAFNLNDTTHRYIFDKFRNDLKRLAIDDSYSFENLLRDYPHANLYLIKEVLKGVNKDFFQLVSRKIVDYLRFKLFDSSEDSVNLNLQNDLVGIWHETGRRANKFDKVIGSIIHEGMGDMSLLEYERLRQTIKSTMIEYNEKDKNLNYMICMDSGNYEITDDLHKAARNFLRAHNIFECARTIRWAMRKLVVDDELVATYSKMNIGEIYTPRKIMFNGNIEQYFDDYRNEFSGDKLPNNILRDGGRE